jgi:hypothetical protein
MKITIVLPDGTRQPLDVPEQATLRRLLPALVGKVELPNRDESGSAVAYYATRHQASELTSETDLSTLADHDSIADDQSLTDLGIQENDVLLLHPVVVAEPEEEVETEPEAQLLEPSSPRSGPRRRQRNQRSRAQNLFRTCCAVIVGAFCCTSVSLFAWIAFEIGQQVESQLTTSAPSQADVATGEIVTFSGNDWDFAVTDAAYNSVSDRLVMISADPHQLHIYDPNNGQDFQMPLSQEPTAVSITPDGRFAAIGQLEQIEIINLDTRAIIDIVPVSGNVYDIVLPNDLWVYYSLTGDSNQFYAIERATHDEKSIPFLGNDQERIFKLAPDGRSLYGTSRNPEPGRLEKIDITRAEPQFMYDSGSTADTCGDVWLAADGRFAVTGCGHIWGLADRKQDDMVLRGNLFETPTKIHSLTHATTTGHVLLITETADQQVQIFDDVQFELLGTESLPEGAHGRYIFTNAAGTQYVVITQTDTGEFGLVTGGM